MSLIEPTAFDLFDYCESEKKKPETCLIEMLERSKSWCTQICHFTRNRYFTDNFHESHLSLVAPFDCECSKKYDERQNKTSTAVNWSRSNFECSPIYSSYALWNDETCHYCAEYGWKWVENARQSLLIHTRSLALTVFMYICSICSQQFSKPKCVYGLKNCVYACGIVDVHCMLLIWWLPHRLESKTSERAFRCMRRGAFTLYEIIRCFMSNNLHTAFSDEKKLPTVLLYKFICSLAFRSSRNNTRPNCNRDVSHFQLE